MPLDDTARRYADNLFAQKSDQAAARYHEGVREAKKDVGRRGLVHSGVHFQSLANLDAQLLRDYLTAKCDSLLLAHETSGVPLTEEVIAEISAEVDGLRARMISSSLSRIRSQIDRSQAVAGPLPGHDALFKAIERQLEQEGAKGAVEIRRNLQSKLDVATLQKRGTENRTREQRGSPPARDNPPTYDVFICHAGENKEYGQQLATECKRVGISVWYDTFCLDWGDDLRCAIDEGLACSRFGIVVLSPTFLRRKKWTEYELSGLFAKEIASQRVILPVWHNITQDQLVAYSPSLAMKFAKDSSKDTVAEIVESLQRKLHPGKPGRSSAASSGDDSITE
jgi:hypothetical protein